DDSREALNHLLYHKPVGEQKALGHHLGMVVLVAVNPTIVELNDDEDGRSKSLLREYEQSRKVSYNHGIMVKKDEDGEYCAYLMNQHPAINKIYDRTQWEGGWRQALARLPGVKLSRSAVWFMGHKQTARAVIIPRDLIPEPELGEEFQDRPGS